MKQKTYLLNTLLAGLLGAVLLAGLVLKAFAPAVILPHAAVPELVALSLVALLAEHRLAPGAKRNYPAIAALAALTFLLLPLASGFAAGTAALEPAALGTAVFTATVFLFESAVARLESGAKAAPVSAALGIYLACQAFIGIL